MTDIFCLIFLWPLHVNVSQMFYRYRLAPENKFPAALDDCLVAYKYFASHAKMYTIDKERIAIAGRQSF